MLATVKALHLIERLVVDESLSFSEELFTKPASVTATEWAPQISKAYVAEPGTAMAASLTEPPGTEWSEVHDVFGLGRTHPR